MKIHTKTLVAVARATALFMGKNDRRYYFNGVHLVGSADKLIVEATDGYRVAQIKIGVVDGRGFNVVVERDAWLEVAKIKTNKKDKTQATLNVEFGVIQLESGAVLPTPTIECRYPDINPVLRAGTIRSKPQTTIGMNAHYAMELFRSAIG